MTALLDGPAHLEPDGCRTKMRTGAPCGKPATHILNLVCPRDERHSKRTPLCAAHGGMARAGTGRCAPCWRDGYDTQLRDAATPAPAAAAAPAGEAGEPR